jgi:uncharacterized protein YicC (UPF0701 family)
MSVKGQLNSARDFLMAGIRASARGAKPNEQAGKLLRACLDLVEHLVRTAEEVTAAEIETTLKVLHQAAGELEQDESASAVLAALQNAIGRLQTLRSEISAPTEPR